MEGDKVEIQPEQQKLVVVDCPLIDQTVPDQPQQPVVIQQPEVQQRVIQAVIKPQDQKSESDHRYDEHDDDHVDFSDKESSSRKEEPEDWEGDKHDKDQGHQKKVEQKIGRHPVRYKYCCRKCKHTERGKKACVCVVPRSQRRMQLGENGCKTCLCHGCSIQDFIARGEDPEYKPKREEQQSVASFEARNGCCKRCIKAFSKNNKSCLCQVPKNVCKVRLPPEGCKFCGCHGCNPQDLRKEAPRHVSRSRSRQRQREKKRYYDDEVSEQGFNNLDGSLMGQLIKQANMLGPLIGFGVPQRTKSYIFGRN